MDALYICNRSNSNDELRYSLRTLEAHAGVENVFMFGGPGWVKNITRIPGRWHNLDKWTNLENCWRAIPSVEDLSEEFIYMNDDFYYLQDCKIPNPEHRGSLEFKIPWNNYDMGGAELLEWLEVWEYEAFNYELHTPMLLTKTGIAKMYQEWGPRPVMGYQRSLYGNVNMLGGTERVDVKRRDPDIGKPYPVVHDFLSSDTLTWYRDPVFSELRRAYPGPSKWEGERILGSS